MDLCPHVLVPDCLVAGVFFLCGSKILGFACFSGNDKPFLPIILVFVCIGLLAGECWDQLRSSEAPKLGPKE